jgi:ABC-2 type transport system permease protein
MFLVKDFLTLLSPNFWMLKNALLTSGRSFRAKTLFYALSGLVFILVVSKLLISGMSGLQRLSPEIFHIILIRGYALIFLIIFFVQVINGAVMSLDRYYQSDELTLILTSPVNRTSLFFARLFETHLKTSWMLIIFGIPLLVSSGAMFQAKLIYYLYALILLLLFSSIPVNLGIGITILASGIINVRTLKKFMVSSGVITGIVTIVLVRFFRPERFVNPEIFANVKIFVSSMNAPSFLLLPTRWLSEALFNFLNGNYSDTLIFTSLLLLTPYVTTIFLSLIYGRYHYRGWSILHGGELIRKDKRRHVSSMSGLAEKIMNSGPVRMFLPSSGSQGGSLFRKDILYQFRDIKNVQQNLILFSLIIVYLFSISALPLNWEGYAVRLKYIISFMNLGLILIIIVSLCSKLVYPVIVSEGSALWIMKTAPLARKKYILTKFLFLFVPICLFGQLLIVFSSFYINIGKTLFMLNVLTVLLVCFSLVSLAVAFSISDLKRSMKGGEEEEVKTGNAAYMVASVLFIIFTLVMEAIPIYFYFMKESEGAIFIQKTWFIMGSVFFVLLFVNIFTTIFSTRLSIRRFDNLQIS